jgi:kinetochore protein Mis12/MTW1
MASQKDQSTALLTEHLRYTPLTLVDDIINTVNEVSARAIDAAEAGLLSAPPERLGFAARAKAERRKVAKDANGKDVFPEAKQEIEEGAHKLETLLEANIDRNFDKLEIYVLRSVLAVPPELVEWIQLAHYQVCDI